MKSNKWPYIAWFVNDWLSDPKVSLCKPATRGILFDWLCNMHLLDRIGSITGTREQLSRLGRCDAVECEAALQDLIRTDAAIITERHDVVTVTNRRMSREEKNRRTWAKRQEKSRSAKNVTHDVTHESPDILSPSPSPKESTLREPEAAIPTLAEVEAYADMHAVRKESAKRFFDHHTDNNLWTNQHGRLIRWQTKLINWAANDRNINTATTNATNQRNRNQGVDRNANTLNAGRSGDYAGAGEVPVAI